MNLRVRPKRNADNEVNHMEAMQAAATASLRLISILVDCSEDRVSLMSQAHMLKCKHSVYIKLH